MMDDNQLKTRIIDEEHLRLLSIFYYIKGGITIFGSLFVGFYFIFMLFISKISTQRNIPDYDYYSGMPFDVFKFLGVFMEFYRSSAATISGNEETGCSSSLLRSSS